MKLNERRLPKNAALREQFDEAFMILRNFGDDTPRMQTEKIRAFGAIVRSLDARDAVKLAVRINQEGLGEQVAAIAEIISADSGIHVAAVIVVDPETMRRALYNHIIREGYSDN
ncbi:MAG: hypothetical protein KGH72_02175 [Candidatus Micrarchaeota archaeon]|nr:hypothetical protein [Candidatus Micrarchaeota archaeon]